MRPTIRRIRQIDELHVEVYGPFTPSRYTRLPNNSRECPVDLSFTRFDRDAEVTELPGDLAVLIVGIAARQAASPTAAVQASFGRATIAPELFAPVHGAFNGEMASTLNRWKEE
jgi:hypothetical protein